MLVAAVALWVRSHYWSDTIIFHLTPAPEHPVGRDVSLWLFSNAGGAAIELQRTVAPISSRGSEQLYGVRHPRFSVSKYHTPAHDRRPHRPTRSLTWRLFGFDVEGETFSTVISIPTRRDSIVFPYWMAALAASVVPGVRVWRAARRSRDRWRGRCARCGYDLRATPERCPECGSAVARRRYDAWWAWRPPAVVRRVATVRNGAWAVALVAAVSLRTPPVPTVRPVDLRTRLETRNVAVRYHGPGEPGEDAADDEPPRREIIVPFVRLPAGEVTLTDAAGNVTRHDVGPLWFARYETRWDEYNVFWMGSDVSERARGKVRGSAAWRAARPGTPYMPPWGDHPDFGTGYPADCVTFLAAQKYCAWLSQQTGKRVRLPTEAEWEYACRAGSPAATTPATEAELAEVAWFAGNDADEQPHPVGRKPPNAWGLYDMLGNVGEFVIRDPKDEKGLLAGGSYKDAAKDVHAGAREPYSPDWQRNDPQEPKDVDWLDYGSAHHVGFRVVMED